MPPSPDSSSLRMSVKNNPHGWAIVGLTLLMQTVSSGLGFYNMSVYINRLSAQLAVSSADTSFAVSLFFVVGGVAGLYVADLLRVWSVRKVVIAGALVSGVAVALVGFADQLWQVYALFTLFGIGNAGISIVISTTLITRWFPGPERSMALAVGSTGLSLGGFLITPLTAYVMNGWGFDLTMHWLGVFLVLSVVPIALFLRFPSNEESFSSQRCRYRAVVRATRRKLGGGVAQPLLYFIGSSLCVDYGFPGGFDCTFVQSCRTVRRLHHGCLGGAGIVYCQHNRAVYRRLAGQLDAHTAFCSG